MRVTALLILLGAIGCKRSDEPASTAEPTTEDSPGKAPIDDAPLFDPDHVVAIQIEMAPADFEALRLQSRDFFEELSGDCTQEPFVSPFTSFEADVIVDGERVERVGVRKKGFFGSLSYETPSLKVSMDEWVEGQLMANGTERLTLQNNLSDPATIKQCLGMSVFAAAGVPASRCNFATVSVNGERLGVYSHLEDVKKDFLRRHFEDDDGDLYEGSLSDFALDWTGTFDAKTSSTDPDAALVHALTAALDRPDGEVIAALEPLLDLPAFYRFWAVEVLLGHVDGYASNQNNFFVYRDPTTDRATFIPWGIDELMGDPDLPPVFLTGRLTQRLWATQAGRDGYVDAMEQALDTAWDEVALNAEIDRMESLLQTRVLDPERLDGALDDVRNFVDERREIVELELQELRDSTERPEMRDPFCVSDLGFVTSDFSTVYGSLEDDPFQYSGTIVAGPVPQGLLTGAVAGGGDYGELLIASLAVTADYGRLYQLIVILPDGVGPGIYPVDLAFASAYLVTADLTDPYDEGDVMGVIFGELTLTEVGASPGAPVVGTVSGSLIGGLF